MQAAVEGREKTKVGSIVIKNTEFQFTRRDGLGVMTAVALLQLSRAVGSGVGAVIVCISHDVDV